MISFQPRPLLSPSIARCAAATLGLLFAFCPDVQSKQPEGSPSPQILFGDLFVRVEREALFQDSKQFADAIPKQSPGIIMADYREHPPETPAALKSFVDAHFNVPSTVAADEQPRDSSSLAIHIDTLWDRLVRQSPVAPPYSSLLPLPRPYVVPGGRFRELYYWDSYFTMLGLTASGRQDLVENMVRDFAHLIDTYGHVPNGTRSYYLTRSQPPFFYAMVALLNPADPAAACAQFLPELQREYAFWMRGSTGLRAGSARYRVVALADGAILNRYWDDSDLPRDESYREDTALAPSSAQAPAALYRNLRAAAESGWDFSSRWFADQHSRATVMTTELVPVDLNSLLFGLENAIRMGCERRHDNPCARRFARKASARQAAVDHYLWDAHSGVYRDYRWTRSSQSPVLSAATFYPLFTALASPSQAAAVAEGTEHALLAQGGVTPTPNRTGEQWDAPNGWAPLQWIAISGLRSYQQDTMAQSIACRWLATVAEFYRSSGKLVEKYNVLDTVAGGGGGEYPLQDGFGWTNGVTRELMVLYPSCAQDDSSNSGH